MKQIKLIFLMVLLAIPFTKARAITVAFSDDGKTMTATVNNSSDANGGSLYWYYYNNTGNQAAVNAITKLVINGESTSLKGALNDRDVFFMRDIINNHSLNIIDLANAKFVATTTDERISLENAKSMCAKFDGETDDDYNTAMANNRPYARYKDEWGYQHYGHTIADQLGEYMFYGCTKLKSVTLPSGITTVSGGSFYGCTEIVSIVIPTTVTTIDWQAFEDCSALAVLTIQNTNITTVNAQAFQNCTSLPDAYFNNLDNVTTIGYRAFKNTLLGDANFASLMSSFKHGNVSSSDGGYNKIPYEAFAGCKSLTTVNLYNVKTYVSDGTTETSLGIDQQAFEGCTGLTSVTLGTNLTTIGEHAFANDDALTSFEVNRGVAPTCPLNAFGANANGTNPNAGVVPNKCTVKFNGEAWNGPFVNSTSFRSDAYSGTVANHYTDATIGYRSYYGQPGFLYLLTKTMDEDNATYDVEKQYHAIVKLQRTFKAGWNTLCLPFGSKNWQSSETGASDVTGDCAELYKNALNGSDESYFMIAAYRGLKKNNNTFIFINYSNFGNDPIDEFEPILVRLSQTDITNHTADNTQTYQFDDVDVNIDHDTSTEYTASTVKPLENVNGEYNTSDIPFAGNTYTDYKFWGTFVKIQGDGSLLLSSDDYYLQNNSFFAFESGKKYASKGYRGYFKKVTTSQAKPSTLNMQMFDEDGTETTGIISITADGEQVRTGDIYNINGQLVRTNASSSDGLAKGLYIMNGKKIIVK